MPHALRGPIFARFDVRSLPSFAEVEFPMSRNLTASWNKAREVPNLLLGWSLCGFLALGAIASTPAAAQLPTSEPDNNNSSIAQTGAIVRPALKEGSRGSEVTELQAALKLLGFYADSVDGIFSQSTAKAVSQFQEAAGIAPDGIVGQDTWNRLFPASEGAIENPIANAPQTADNTEINPQQQPTNFPVLRRRMRGPAVRDLQERLRAKGFLRASADGVFGPETQAAVKAAQRQYQLPADGIVGHATWEALLR
ncbi:peptidoglycan-binding protein [Microcoleus sp. ARI1-B5]|uniref:peptidoglycan-binding domain-containing protein n=1 Tax=unclassified Microcoleus TaxID=2642155 RepID=UPI002FD100C0